MGNRKVYWIISLILIGNSLIRAGDKKSFFYYYNPDVVIQSAFIEDGVLLEYSIPDLTTFSHFRLSAEFDSTFEFHAGIGLFSLDAGLSFHLLNYYTNALRLRLDFGTGIRGVFFTQLQMTPSIYKTQSMEIGFNFTVSVRFEGVYVGPDPPLNFDNLIFDYWSDHQLPGYAKSEIYFLLYKNRNFYFGCSTGITHSAIFEKDATYNLNDMFQFGLSFFYRINN